MSGELPTNYIEVRVVAVGDAVALLKKPPQVLSDRAARADKLLMVPLAGGAILAMPLLDECCGACRHSRQWNKAAFVGWCELHGGHVPTGATCTAFEANT